MKEDTKQEFKEWLITRKSKKQITEAGQIEDWSGGQTDEELLLEFDKMMKLEKEKFEKITAER